MTWSEFLLFFHVTIAVIWVGGGLMMQFFALRVTMSGDPGRMATFGQDVKWIADRVFIPGSLLAFASGVLLVVDSDFYGFGDDWIVIALALYATTFFAGLLFLGPEAGRVGKLTAEGSPEAGPRTQRLLMLSRLDLVLLFVMLYVMTVKPSFDDTASILWGVAGALVAGGLVVWRYLATSARPAGAEAG
jgi:uncharacterized membrane protein